MNTANKLTMTRVVMIPIFLAVLYLVIPPYNHYVVLGPVNPDQVARDIKARIGFETCIVDINDLEGQILGVSSKALDKHLYARILKHNPLGQDDQQTPMGIIRKL